MHLTKSCPRCHGDVYFDRDHDGAWFACYQCGHILTQSQILLLQRTVRVSQPAHQPQPKVAAGR